MRDVERSNTDADTDHARLLASPDSCPAIGKRRLVTGAPSIKRVIDYDCIRAIRAGRDNIDRHADDFSQAVEVIPRRLRQLVIFTNTGNGLLPAGHILV